MKNKNRVSKLISTVLVIVLTVSLFAGLNTSALSNTSFVEDPMPVNNNANDVCKNFYRYLCNISQSNSVLSGAFSYRLSGVDAQGSNNGENPENDYYKFIENLFGVRPVIMGCSLSDEYIPVIAERYSKGAVPLIQVSVTAEIEGTPKDSVVNFDAENPDRNPDIYKEYRNNLAALGRQLKELEKSGVDVYILRPWIEMNNSSNHGFWGDTDKGYTSFQNMWKQAVDYLLNEVGLKGILFAYAPMGYDGSKQFYPGSDYVDINAPTVYSNSADGELYESDCKDYEWMRYENRPFAFSETAARTGLANWMIAPVGDYKVFIESVLSCFPEISFIDLWFMDAMSIEPAGNSTTKGNYNGEYLIRHPQVIVESETLDYRNTKSITPIRTAMFYNSKGQSVSFYEGDFDSSDFSKEGLKLTDIVSLDVMHGYAVEVCATNKNYYYFGSTKDLNKVFSKADSVRIFKLENVALNKPIWSDNGDDGIFRFNDGMKNRCVTEQTNQDGSVNITIDLESEYIIGQLSIEHAGFYEDSIYNMRDFEVLVSTDGDSYKSVYKCFGNTLSVSNICFNAQKARYVKIHVITPNSSSSKTEKDRLSIADIQVLGIESETLSDYELDDFDSYDDDTQTGQLSDYGENDVQVISTGKPNAVKYVIPAFYKYVWLIFCGGILLIAGTVWAILYLYSRKKSKK